MRTNADPIRRFSGRTADYARYRPRYPVALIPLLRFELDLSPSWTVADIGSGTGLSTELFLEFGCEVLGVEPNAEMREVAVASLPHPRFRSVAGRAEATTLPSCSIDLVAAGQAFHWFDPGLAGGEFRRILRPPGRVALVWNTRRLDGNPFLREYETLLLRFGTDYERVRHDTRREDLLNRFFAGPLARRTLPNEQSLDREGLRGRLLSCSYTPDESDPARGEMLTEADALFDRHSVGVRWSWSTRRRSISAC